MPYLLDEDLYALPANLDADTSDEKRDKPHQNRGAALSKTLCDER